MGSASAQPRARPAVGILVPEDEGMPPGLDELSGTAEVHLARTDGELREIAGRVEVLFVWDFRRPRLRSVWPEAGSLRWIQAASAGVDAILFDELTESDVVVTNTRGVLDESIAEWVLGCLLMLVKDLDTTVRLQVEHRWEHRNSGRLAGRRLLVLGAGSIGRAVARLCRAAGMEVDGLGSRARPGDGDFGQIYGSGDLHRALGRADAAVLCLPLTADTRGMIGAPELAAMPAGSILVNAARGPIVDEGALIEALRSGHLAAAALDVFEQEPLDRDHPFWDMPKVIVSPHMAGDFDGWEEEFSAVFLENLERWMDGRPLRNVVDKAKLSPSGPGA